MRNEALAVLTYFDDATAGLQGYFARESRLPFLKDFAQRLLSDRAAVAAALSSEWSNGQTEGQVNRLKLIKRQMYGRAGFDLLRVRVLAVRVSPKVCQPPTGNVLFYTGSEPEVSMRP